jgi:heme/copper-type cytochrome/quinol oxidase subunit 2
MLFRLLVLIVLGCSLSAVEPLATPEPAQVDQYVALFNQDLYALDANRKVVTPITGAFDAPASDIARDVASGTWFSCLVFLPFLVLPQVLLVYIIFKFRKKEDGRAPATFMGNHKLEIIWTAIPCLALIIVGIPMYDLLYKMEAPPADQRRDMVVEVRGKSFAWDYKYQRLGGDLPTRREEQYEVGQDVVGLQEPLILVKDRRVILNLTSNDVNHAWWIPAFGVKKDAMKGRYTNVWFTPRAHRIFQGAVCRAVRPGSRCDADQRPGARRSRFFSLEPGAATPRRQRSGLERNRGRYDRCQGSRECGCGLSRQRWIS